MAAYIARRCAYAVVVVFVILSVSFVLLRVVPGDPALLMLGLQTPRSVVVEVRRDLGLDKSVGHQYVRYLEKIVKGDFGQSIRQRQPVLPLVLSGLGKSAALAALAISIAICLALVLGLVAGIYRNSLADRTILVGVMIGQSLPNFWIGTMLLLLVSVKLRLLPSYGYVGFKSLLLPAITLAIGLVPVLTRYIRAASAEVMSRDFVLSLRSRGVSERRIVFGHVLPNISVPLITILSQQSGYLLAGAFIVEGVFNFPGVGFLGLVAAQTRDLTLLQGIVVVVSTVFVMINLLTDLTYPLIDPRIRLA
jgi:ABC-type dipeptide/oligopeptide/nickel transport system permease component